MTDIVSFFIRLLRLVWYELPASDTYQLHGCRWDHDDLHWFSADILSLFYQTKYSRRRKLLRSWHTISIVYFSKLAERAGIPKGVVNVVSASRLNAAAIGKLMCEHRRVATVSFTGSCDVGKVSHDRLRLYRERGEKICWFHWSLLFSCSCRNVHHKWREWVWSWEASRHLSCSTRLIWWKSRQE